MRAGSYPCWLYDAAGGHLFKSEEQHLAHEGVLYESPADVPPPVPPEPPAIPSFGAEEAAAAVAAVAPEPAQPGRKKKG